MTYRTISTKKVVVVDGVCFSSRGNENLLESLCKAILQVLDMELIAESVKVQEQADCLLSNSCAIAQGYLLGKPAVCGV